MNPKQLRLNMNGLPMFTEHEYITNTGEKIKIDAPEYLLGCSAEDFADYMGDLLYYENGNAVYAVDPNADDLWDLDDEDYRRALFEANVQILNGHIPAPRVVEQKKKQKEEIAHWEEPLRKIKV